MKMKLFSQGNYYTLYQGDMLNMLEVITPNSIDSVITDPPYELNFMNKGWDNSGIAFQANTWRKCYEVLKPGGYLLAFGGSRTFHRIACAIEDAGFEIRDTIMWLYGSGFPKSFNIGKGVEAKMLTGSSNTQAFKNLNGTKAKSGDWGVNKNAHEYGARPAQYDADKHLRTVSVDYQTEEGRKWNGWGTQLKPSYEPIIVARKPCKGSVTDNILQYGVGGINIDECRIGTEIIKAGSNPDFRDIGRKSKETIGIDKLSFGQVENVSRTSSEEHVGRYPANTILTYDDDSSAEVCSGFPDTKGVIRQPTGNKILDPERGWNNNSMKDVTVRGFNDSGSAARYFYCAKASKKDRNDGVSGRNSHPTVKPTELMQYLIRLVTPNGGTVLDPFNGSGSTGKAVMYENNERSKGYKYIGIELTEEYLPISKARIEYAQGAACEAEPAQTQEVEQLSFF